MLTACDTSNTPPGPTATSPPAETPSPAASQTPSPEPLTALEQTQAYKELPDIQVGVEAKLVASPSHPTAYLWPDVIPAGGYVRLVAMDADASWLLVLYRKTLGWIPSFYSATGTGILELPMLGHPVSEKCAFLGATQSAEQQWVSPIAGDATVHGMIYQPKSGAFTESASVKLSVEGPGAVVGSRSDYLPLQQSGELAQFAYTLTDLKHDSRVRFQLPGLETEPIAFLAGYFSADCPQNKADTFIPATATATFLPATPEATATVILPTSTQYPTLTPELTAIPAAQDPYAISADNAGNVTALLTLDPQRNKYSINITRVVWSPDGSILAVASSEGDNSVRLWRVSDGALMRTLEGHTAAVLDVVFTQDGQNLISYTDDDLLWFWRVADGTLVQSVPSKAITTNLAISPDGTTLALGLEDSSIMLWGIDDRLHELRTLAKSDSPISGLAFSPDGTRIMSVSGSMMTFWSIATGIVERNLDVKYQIYSLSMASDWSMAAVATNDGKLSLWDLITDSSLLTIQAHRSAVNKVRFSMNGQIVATASDDQTVRLWSVEGGIRVIKSLEGHSDAVVALAFSPDGHTLASGANDGIVQLWGLPLPSY